MGLLITMLPIYVLGNLHCLGMCGPLAMLLGANPQRYLYFLGRIASFTLVATLAGEVGSVLHTILSAYHIPAATSFIFGGVIILVAVSSLTGIRMPGGRRWARLLAGAEARLSSLLTRDSAQATFFFGFMTVALPCGQSLLVFSACALSGSALVGALNGFAFALLTSPSLWLAMHARQLIARMKDHYNAVMGILALIVGALALCRGLAEAGMIPHFVLNPSASDYYHVILY